MTLKGHTPMIEICPPCPLFTAPGPAKGTGAHMIGRGEPFPRKSRQRRSARDTACPPLKAADSREFARNLGGQSRHRKNRRSGRAQDRSSRAARGWEGEWLVQDPAPNRGRDHGTYTEHGCVGKCKMRRSDAEAIRSHSVRYRPLGAVRSRSCAPQSGRWKDHLDRHPQL